MLTKRFIAEGKMKAGVWMRSAMVKFFTGKRDYGWKLERILSE
jgi:hypothetical protein